MTSTKPVDDPRILPVSQEQAWEALARAGLVDCALLRPEIARSWDRCLSMGVDPYVSRTSPVEDSEELFKEQRFLLKVALPHMRRLYENLKGNGFIVSLIGPEGLILEIFGDKCMVSTAESLDIVKGFSNSETALGTTAPGICIERQVPVQVLVNEHFCQLYHNWCCSAAPFFDSTGNLMGVLNVSNINLPCHQAHILYMVQMAAEAIGAEVNYRKLHDNYRKTYLYCEHILDKSTDALLVLDNREKLVHMNSSASTLLGVPSNKLLGCKAHTIVTNFHEVKKSLKDGKQQAELHVETPGKRLVLDAQFAPIFFEGNKPLGILTCLSRKKTALPQGGGAQYEFSDFIYRSPSIGALLEHAKKMALTDETVLIQGESGTGKEVICQAIHNYSSRSGKPFVPINCASLPRELIQSELFGYESGSFTGAHKQGKAGKFELAGGGTLFLDEIGDMPLEAQANLLRVLQERMVVRIGGVRSKSVDIRIIAATNKDLMQEIAAGRFRRDLYYRLAVINLFIPPLHQRREDIWALIEHFINIHRGRTTLRAGPRFSKAAKAVLQGYDWPGNVRELQNTVIFILNKIKGATVGFHDLPAYMVQNLSRQDGSDLEEVERQTINSTLYQTGNHISNTARRLGISRATLYRKIKKYNIVTT